jgi:4'-phosphopantetheinyl transferase
MPLLLRKKSEDGLICGIWQRTESDEYFLSEMQLYPQEIEEISVLKSRKKSEWLASRYLLHVLSQRGLRGACLKDAYGKPYLEGSSWYISMSHSHDMVAVAAAEVPVGVDIQFLVPKIERIAPRFLSEKELSQLNLDYRTESLHVCWGAKECIYKAYGRKSLDYRSDIYISKFCFEPDGFRFKGTLQKMDFTRAFQVTGQQFQNYIFTYAIQI